MLKGFNCWLPSFDNLSTMSPAFSDTLCRLSTGAADSKRKLYADSDEVVYAFSRPVMLNGIGEVGTAPDYLDRALLLNLPLLQTRKDEQSLDAAFEAARPALLGALLDMVAVALRNRATVQVKDLPRLADFYLWVVAAGLDGFEAAYTDNRDNAVSLEVEASPFVRAVLAMLHDHPRWKGSAETLAQNLERYADEGARRSVAWPHGPRKTSTALDKWAGTLRSQGVSIEKGRTKSGRWIELALDRPANVIDIRPAERGYVVNGTPMPF